MIARIRAWWRRLAGDRCDWCGGDGYYSAFSPVDPLDTIRKARRYKCRRCDGTGRVYPPPAVP